MGFSFYKRHTRNHMETKILSVKFSIFGGYDFIDNTPETVSKLYRLFENDCFMPNILTLLKIEQPDNNLIKSDRPQLINKSMPCTISFLPERIDIEIGTNIEIERVTEYFDNLINLFGLDINRLALYKTTIFESLENYESKRLMDRVASPINYFGEDNLIEYSSRRVNRIKFDCLNEFININRNLTGISSVKNGANVFDKLQVETDINTLGENTKDRFKIGDCRNFFIEALEYDSKILEMVEAFINEQ